MSPEDFMLSTDYDSFKNDNVYTGTFTISGPIPVGYSTRTFTLPIGNFQGMADVSFRGNASGRPGSSWFRSGVIEVGVTWSGMSGMQPFMLSSNMSGSNVVITASTVNNGSATLNPTSTGATFSAMAVTYSEV